MEAVVQFGKACSMTRQTVNKIVCVDWDIGDVTTREEETLSNRDNRDWSRLNEGVIFHSNKKNVTRDVEPGVLCVYL